MTTRRMYSTFFGLCLLLVLLAVDQSLFQAWFGIDHLRWYVSMGASIGVVTSVASLAWGDLERHPGLVSAHPMDYLGSCMQLVGLPIHAMGTHMRRTGSEPRAGTTFDALLAIPLVLLLVAVLVAWLVVIAPPQYFVHLVCGAPARLFATSALQPVARLQDGQLAVGEVSAEGPLPAGSWGSGLSRRPVATTSLFTSLVFLIVRPLVG